MQLADEDQALGLLLRSFYYHITGREMGVLTSDLLAQDIRLSDWLAAREASVAAAVRAAALEACEAALTKDADPSVWWFVGEAINRIRAAVDKLGSPS